MKDFTLHRLPFDAICLATDQNFPWRAEQVGSMDIDRLTPIFRTFAIPPGSVAVDVGAFIGDTALVMARLGWKVIAFEPFFDAFVCLVYNTREYDVRCMNVPVGNGEYVTMNPLNDGDNFGMRWVAPSEEVGSVLTTRIDELRLDRCDFIKVDCEGSEIRALLGARQTIARFHPKLFVEVYSEALVRAGSSIEYLNDLLDSLGYNREMIGEPPRWDWYCTPKAL